MLKDYCNKENIIFVDVFSLFVKDGYLEKSFSYDDLHINGKAYVIWAKAIDSLVRN
jgi:lysophospholipase L1-like esterase